MQQTEINIESETNLTVSTREVVRLVAKKILPNSNLTLTAAPGSGVHLIFPMIPASTDVNIFINENAHFTMSILGQANELLNNLKLNVNLIGDNAKANIELAFIGNNNNESSLRIDLNHQAINTVGRITARRIQHENSVSTLKGMLKIEKGAHHTDTYLSDKALLMGVGSRAEADPQLEILADDVKASHGVTIGQISTEELFYLTSRGINANEAQGLILAGFLKPALIGVPLVMTQEILYGL